MRGSLWLLAVFATIVTPGSASEGQDVPDAAAETTVRCRSGFWPPRDRTVGWNADRHAPALRIKLDDREQPARDRPEWIQWRATHGAHRSYQNASAEELHARIFEETETMILENRAAFLCGEALYEIGINQFADLTQDEGAQMLMSEDAMKAVRELNSSYDTIDFQGNKDTVVRSIDWREIIDMPPVKNQGYCGSCYTFATIGVIESRIAKLNKGKNVTPVILSEQYLVDCTFGKLKYGFNFACKGGDPISTMLWAATNAPLPSSQLYPYTSDSTFQQGTCKTIPPGNDYRIDKMFTFGRFAQEEGIEGTLVQYGPAMACLNGENDDFYNYKEGIYNNPSCSTRINHVVVAMGFGVEERTGTRYWILRNSWGESWGEKGHMRLIRGFNRCGFPSQGVGVTYAYHSSSPN